MNPVSDIYKYFSRKEILKDREIEYPLTPEMEQNLLKLIECLNVIREAWGKPIKVTSGYRPGRYNTQAGGAKNSAHVTCQAADLADADGLLKKFLSNNVELLEKAGLWMEHPSRTPQWVHLQLRKPKSGSRIFMP